MVTLDQLLHGLTKQRLHGSPHVPIDRISNDSRQVSEGSLFVAVPGLSLDGHRFIADAVQRGAVAVVGQRDIDVLEGLPPGIPYVQVEDTRLALAQLAAAFYGHPSRRLCMIGVTGTDGKTTTTNLIHSILSKAGIAAGMISTVNARIGDRCIDTGLHTTTPEAVEVQHYLAEMVNAGTRVAILETTSHGLAQHRVSACDFDIAVLTNITHEHLDYHGSYEAYRNAKAMLFWDVSRSRRKPGIPKVAILNADDASHSYLQSIPISHTLLYGLSTSADIRAQEVQCTEGGISFVTLTPAGRFPVRSQLIGEHNLYNLLAAISVGVTLKLPPEEIQAGIQALTGLIGRMERIDLGQPFTVIVDFAHTPNALRNALQTARAITRGKLTVVFGCPGLRDIQKRHLMGGIAAELADRIILTADDPRTEDVGEINSQIVLGYCASGRKQDENLRQVEDRAQAIQQAIDLADPGDMILIAGKGHQQSLSYGNVEIPWSDHEVTREALVHWLAQAGSTKNR